MAIFLFILSAWAVIAVASARLIVTLANRALQRMDAEDNARLTGTSITPAMPAAARVAPVTPAFRPQRLFEAVVPLTLSRQP